MSTTRTPLDRGAAATGLGTVVAANVVYLTGLPLILDPMTSMEPFYIHMAQRPVSTILSGDPSWGPLYAVWLKPFVAAFGDPLAVYAANLYALSFAISLLLYVYLLRLTRRVAPAAGAALFFLISDFNVPLPSKVSGFALMTVLAGLTVSELFPAGARRMSVATLGVLLASYARPELYPSALCLCLAAFWLARSETGESTRNVLSWPAMALAVMLIAAVSFGSPAFDSDESSGRFFLAFQEHFAWNWSRWHNEWQDVFSIWEQEFGAARCTLQALLTNPAAVAHHLADNLLGTIGFMAGSAFGHYPLLAPVTAPALVRAESLLISAAAFGSLAVVAGRSAVRRRLLADYGHALFQYAALALFCLAAATAIFPMAHYLVIPAVLMLLAGTLAATEIIPARRGFPCPKRVLAALVCLLAVPRPFVLPSAYVVPGSSFKGRITVARTITDTVDFIRSLGLAPPVQVLTLTDGVGELLGGGFHEVKIWQNGAQPLDAYMRDHDVGVVVNLEGGKDSFLVSDPYWRQFQDDPAAAGFARLAVPNNDVVAVYVRTDLLRR